MRHARDAVAGDDAHALAELEFFVGFLGDSDGAAGVELHGNLVAFFARGRFLDGADGDAAEHRPDDRAGAGALAVADFAAADAADDASPERVDMQPPRVTARARTKMVSVRIGVS